MRVRVSEALEHYNSTNNLIGNDRLSQRQLCKKIMPNRSIAAAQDYIMRINKGKFGNNWSLNMMVIKRLIEFTSLPLDFLIDLEQ